MGEMGEERKNGGGGVRRQEKKESRIEAKVTKNDSNGSTGKWRWKEIHHFITVFWIILFEKYMLYSYLPNKSKNSVWNTYTNMGKNT